MGLRRVSRAILASCAVGAVLAAQAAVSEPASAVRIHRDELGLPHVFAASDAGVFRGLGYSQVRDFPVATLSNLWSASGRFAEVAGELALVRDERMRRAGLDRRTAELASDPAALDPLVRGWLVAYVAGVNEGRAAWLAHPEWIDALAGEGGALGFDPVPPWLHPQRVKDSPRARLARLFAAEVGLEHVLAHGLALAAGPEFGGGGYSTFTNVWLMRGSESDPHTRILADVHQPLQDFGYRTYPVQLAGPSYDLVGNTVPGFPCIVLGASRSVAFASMTLPKKPRALAAAGLPFRVDERTPLVHAEWRARLEPDEPPRFLRAGQAVGLIERRVTLRYWDTARSELVDDPRGALTLRWVPGMDGFELPVVEPGPTDSLALAERPVVRYEARSFLGQRSLWETWMRLGLCTHVGGDEAGATGGIDGVLARECLATGRGQMVLACDVAGGLSWRWATRAARLGAAALERFRATREPGVLDGQDPATGWLGFHGFEDLPGGSDRGVFGARPEAWIECNSSPHALHPSLAERAWTDAPTVWDGEPWQNRRQDRARELFERAAADGKLALEELERMALDVQDQWSRASWPWLCALTTLAEGQLSERARAFVAWLDEFRTEGPDGKPGAEEFLAHPLSQVMPFLVLIRDRYEDELVTARAPAEALALAFDPALRATPPAAFAGEARFAANRAALRAAVEWAAELRARTLAGEPGRLANLEYLRELAARTKDCRARLAPDWLGPHWTEQAAEWGPGAPPVALRWGHVNPYVLTPHRWSFVPVLTNARQVEGWLASNLAPCTMEPPLPYYRAQPAVVFPVGGTHDSLFQVHREGFVSYARSLVPHGADWLALAPVDFGSQALFLAELVPGARPRVRVLPALGATEITVDVPGHGARAGDLFLPTERFARGEWSELVTDEARLRAGPSPRTLELP
jgi:penicillin amidase